MNRQTFVVAALAAVAPLTLAAQEKTPPPPTAKPVATPPQQRSKEHEALRSLLGYWEVTYKLTPPGAEKPVVSTGTERTELICDGMWLQSSTHGEFDGKPFEGLWLLGYDPHNKTYRTIAVDNQEPAPVLGEARYDEKTKTWEFTGSSNRGAFKTKMEFEDADTIVETGTCTAEDGKESKVLFTRKRAKAARPVGAAATSSKPASKEHELLAKAAGDWDAVMKMVQEPGAEPTQIKATETVTVICDGKWTWSDFQMEWDGKPFEGHALVGYDKERKQYVSYWFDSTSATWGEALGAYDPETKTTTMTGTMRDENGKTVTTKQVITWRDEDARHMTMECTGDKPENFEITYRRRGKR